MGGLGEEQPTLDHRTGRAAQRRQEQRQDRRTAAEGGGEQQQNHRQADAQAAGDTAEPGRRLAGDPIDRKSVVEGKKVTVRGGPGGSRIMKTNIKAKKQTNK